ncbi:GntR family transcriptional regulator [Thermotoga sp. KOL6]|uniref:GntR family transcriptional regulator n=1 Tax=Thermotoga sp. KOL6 TaxID=126741 RepID=UPI000C763504|nr:GntR family transcriptional regulator [Thermotoga sp. KOL6]PLV59464.1 GntR family transcriptional regulator [Thermotoga sp. KOL6]
MWFKINFHSSKPIYEQIKDRIKLLILSGKLKEGEFVPSIRSLAEDLGVNLNTVSRAYRELVQEGILEVKRGEGYVVTRVDKKKIQMQLEEELIKVLRDCKRAGIPFERVQKLIEIVYRGEKTCLE